MRTPYINKRSRRGLSYLHFYVAKLAVGCFLAQTGGTAGFIINISDWYKDYVQRTPPIMHVGERGYTIFLFFPVPLHVCCKSNITSCAPIKQYPETKRYQNLSRKININIYTIQKLLKNYMVGNMRQRKRGNTKGGKWASCYSWDALDNTT